MPPRVRKSTPAELASTDEPVETEELDQVEELFVLDLTAETREDVKTFEVRINDTDSVFIPMPDTWSVGASLKFQQMEIVAGFEMLGLSDEEIDLLLSLPNAEFTAVMDYAAKIAGITPGEGKRSAKSSRSTATRSKRTSGRSTTASTSATTSRRGTARAS